MTEVSPSELGDRMQEIKRLRELADKFRTGYGEISLMVNMFESEIARLVERKEEAVQ